MLNKWFIDLDSVDLQLGHQGPSSRRSLEGVDGKEAMSIARRALDVRTGALSKFLHPPMQHYCLHRNRHSLNPT